ncbi:MAG: hypothetical protein JWR52_3889 [Marmoricola sp.]|nr:hypothetical protein [Marmoricola sp.]
MNRCPPSLRKRFIPARRACCGQALTEFLVLALVLIPLVLLIPILAKYQDVAFAVQMSSRYVAFEAMTRNDSQNTSKTPAQLSGEVQRRFFSNGDAPIKTGDVAGNFLAHQNLFWRGPDGAPLIADFDKDVSIGFGTGNGPTQGEAYSAAKDGAPFNLVKTADNLGLNAKGIYTGNVSVKLANLPAGLRAYEPFDKIDLSITRHTSVLVDGWPANTPGQVEARINSPLLVPGAKLAVVAPVVDAAVTAIEIGQIRGPQLGKLDFWRDVVPPDHVK